MGHETPRHVYIPKALHVELAAFRRAIFPTLSLKSRWKNLKMKRIENSENNNCWESCVFAGIEAGALRKRAEDKLWLTIMSWEPENCVMLVLKLLSGDIWGQIHQVLNLHVHIQTFPTAQPTLHSVLPASALGNSQSWKTLENHINQK